MEQRWNFINSYLVVGRGLQVEEEKKKLIKFSYGKVTSFLGDSKTFNLHFFLLA